MTQDSYSFEQNQDAMRFDFASVNGRKILHKRIEYSPTNTPNVYNLALGDVTATGVVDDQVRSNNNDRDKVIATVAQTLLVFLGKYPDRYVIFRGSTDSRTRLYRAAISRELDNARQLFDIYGVLTNHRFEPFQPGNQYIAFIITAKK